MEPSTTPHMEASSQPATLTPALIKSFNDYPWVKDRQFLVSLASFSTRVFPVC
jgi:hypothetical protein